MYASPEVLATSKHGRVSDVFSMGCVWLEMYTVLLGERLEDFEQDRLSPSESFSEDLDNIEASGLRGGFKSFAASLSSAQKWIERLIVYCNVHGSLILGGAEKFPGLDVSCNEIVQGLHNVEQMLQEDPNMRPDTRTLRQMLGANQCCGQDVPLVKVAEGSLQVSSLNPVHQVHTRAVHDVWGNYGDSSHQEHAFTNQKSSIFDLDAELEFGNFIRATGPESVGKLDGRMQLFITLLVTFSYHCAGYKRVPDPSRYFKVGAVSFWF